MIRRGYRYFTTSRILRNEVLLEQEQPDVTLEPTPEPTPTPKRPKPLPPKNFKIHTTKPTSPDSWVKTIEYDKDTKVDITQLRETRGTRLVSSVMSVAEYFLGNTHHSHHVFYLATAMKKAKRAARVEKRAFIDLKLIKLTSGQGGNGSVSFFKDAFKPFGPADGGDGGNGGNVFINVVDLLLANLHGLKKLYIAKNGLPGKSSQLDGKNGEDVIIDVPVGTVIRWIPDPQEFKKYVSQREGDCLDDIYMEFEMDDMNQVQLYRGGFEPGDGWLFKEHDEEYYRERDFFRDMNKKVMEYDKDIMFEERYNDRFPILGLDCDKVTPKPLLLLRGGRGGLGNMHFTSKDIRGAKFCKMGRPGITSTFLLELKLIADLGLVGLPNAGKSSLLRAISKATPRVGHWEFTTLQPTVGTIFRRIDEDPFTVADIPGIIKGASENKGMGLDFLRHIERSGGLVFVVSLESLNPVADLEILLEEVGPKRMKDKKVLIVATKADLSEEGANFKVLRDYVNANHKDWKLVPVCAPNGENVDKCIRLMGEIAKGETRKK
ncbi:GTPase MTG2, mitochondrial [Candida viswanathii]|uniref:GTPase MTG2, mitochondrial n=1 Tax=Candida viswanathii TaxID=5486 RepID=A0A367Y918_9ASCO|nr:GTPase MTG2, mitochondrial [Candida viswanathii]